MNDFKLAHLSNNQIVKIILDDEISSALLIYKIRDVKEKFLLMKPIIDYLATIDERCKKEYSSSAASINLLSSRLDIKRDEHYLLETLLKLFHIDYPCIDKILRQLNIINNLKFYQIIPNLISIQYKLEPFFKEIQNPQVMLLIILKTHGSRSLDEIPPRFRNIKAIVMEVIGNGPLQLHQASNELRNDREVVMKASKVNVQSFQYASRELRHEKKMALEIVQIGIPTFSLALFSRELRDDFDFVKKMVKVNGRNLRFASNRLRANSEIVLEAISQNGEAIEYVNLPKSERMWLESIRTYPKIIPKLPKSLQYSTSFWKQAVEQSSSVFYYLKLYCKSKNRREIELVAIKKFGNVIRYISEEYKNDREIVVAAIREFPSSYQYASEELRNDREIALMIARKGNFYLISLYSSEELKKDKEFLRELFKIDPKCSLIPKKEFGLEIIEMLEDYSIKY